MSAPNDQPASAARRQRLMAYLLAAGCVWFAVLALTRPRRMAEILRSETWLVRTLGVRDLASAAALVSLRDPRPAILARILFDLADTATFARRRPPMAAVALAYAGIGVFALRAGRA